MQIYKKPKESNNNNEYLKMTSSIKSEPINNVCFECGEKDPQYISINNAIFICKDCIVNHISFSQEISKIILNDLYLLNLSEVKMLYLGGNRKLIQFINFDYPGLKQLPPNILYKTIAVDYYRKNLNFLTNGGKRPLKPSVQIAYNLLEDFGNNYFENMKSEKNLGKYCNTQLATIFEGKDENEEKDEKDNNEENISVIQNNNNYEDNNELKEDIEKKTDIDDDNTKNESTLINTPQEKINKGNIKNNSAIINTSNSLFSKSFQNEIKNYKNFDTIINKYNNKNSLNEYKNKILKEDNEEINDNLNINEEIKFNADKNISEIIINNEENEVSSNFNLKSSDLNNISGDENTIKIFKGDFSDIKSNKENNDDSSNSLIKEEINQLKNESINKKSKNNTDINDSIETIEINTDKKMKTESNIREKSNRILDKENNDDIRLNNKIIRVKKKENNNNSYMENQKRKKIPKEEEIKNNDNDDINYDDIKIIAKRNNKNNNKIVKNENKSSKNIIIKKKNDFSSEEESEEKEEEDIIKSAIYKNNQKEKESKMNLTEIKPNNHLKAKIYSSRVTQCYNTEKDDDDDFCSKKTKTKKILNTTERSEITKKRTKKDIDKNDNFFSKKSKFGSGFINPLKYLQKSFQKKQNEKFEQNSDSSGEEEESYESDEINNKKNGRNIFKIRTQSKRFNTYINNKIYDNMRNSDDEEVD